MKNEYIIINKSVLEKRIEELEKDPIYLQWEYDIKTHNGHSPQQRERKKIVDLELELLKEILSQSTPLIPEIEKHSIEFTKNLLNCTVSEAKSIDNIKEYHPKEYQLLLGELELNGKKIFEDYISNLKLDIQK